MYSEDVSTAPLVAGATVTLWTIVGWAFGLQPAAVTATAAAATRLVRMFMRMILISRIKKDTILSVISFCDL